MLNKKCKIFYYQHIHLPIATINCTLEKKQREGQGGRQLNVGRPIAGDARGFNATVIASIRVEQRGQQIACPSANTYCFSSPIKMNQTFNYRFLCSDQPMSLYVLQRLHGFLHFLNEYS